MDKKVIEKDYKKVTTERMQYVAKMYRGAIKDIYTNGKVYLVELNEGYEIDGKKKVEAKNITKICYYSWLATDSKAKKEHDADTKTEKEGKIAITK